ncbi:AAA family ATPase [Desulfovibrio subterraneus]|uniref:TrlF family AAA-like ATPase n=1 Tax=Desulfovibrio subterraneus TaxID=2718620 RepID=UPI0022B8F945|nr:AAA family ATPase [Desulfovibrio subterraneus]WBF68813.1 AAA family ATPase [Desulfovibrio subterraneus]
MSTYNGMKWYKCDFHMHSPSDPSWLDDKVSSDKEGGESYIRRCYEVGLDVIAITNHGCYGLDFTDQLRSTANSLAHEYGRKLHIFYGFELIANVGKGFHVLAIFDEKTNKDVIKHKYSNLDVIPETKNWKSTKTLTQILETVQGKDISVQVDGIVIAPHVMNEGIFDNKKTEDWLQSNEYKNPNLLACEINKPIYEMHKNWIKIFNSTETCHDDWKRSRRISCLMSSDTKRLTKNSSEHHYIGSRFTWVKMSNPTIEGVRQAFLDPEKRVIVSGELKDNPKNFISYPYIHSIEIKNGKFIKDQKILFSHSLNCIIGGRGSGKSTILECIRQPYNKTSTSSSNFERICNSFNRNTTINSEWHNGTNIDIISYNNESKETSINNYTNDEKDGFLNLINMSIFSQREISDSYANNDLLNTIDLISKIKIKSLNSDIINLQGEAISLARSVIDKQTLNKKIIDTKQQIKILRKQLSDSAQIGKILKKQTDAQEEIETIDSIIQSFYQSILNSANELSQQNTNPSRTQYQDISINICNIVNEHISTIKNEILSKLDSIKIDTTEEKDFLYFEIEKHNKNFIELCKKHNITEEKINLINTTKSAISTLESTLKSSIIDLERAKDRANQFYEKINNIQVKSSERHDVRLEIINTIYNSSTIPLTKDGKPFINIKINKYKSFNNFIDKWSSVYKEDKRQKLGKYWEQIGEELFEEYLHSGSTDSPFLYINNNLGDFIKSENFTYPEIEEGLKSTISPTNINWLNSLANTVEDDIDISLYRSDGTIAGSFKDRTLSDGQMNTAILAILLSYGNWPIIIDQPEDELDSNFIYTELVPILRNASKNRQIILASHNANIPVNGDADLIYALESKDGKGIHLCSGGLDIPEVKEAVLNIMEGSEQAFKRRRERYMK